MVPTDAGLPIKPDRTEALREQIVGLAHHHHRYGARMIYLVLPHAGQMAYRSTINAVLHPPRRCSSCVGVPACRCHVVQASTKCLDCMPPDGPSGSLLLDNVGF